jgi:hypothetical protein
MSADIFLGDIYISLHRIYQGMYGRTVLGEFGFRDCS